MIKTVCKIIVLLSCVLALFCGCGDNKNPVKSLGIISIYSDICNDGELFIDNPSARLNFIDFQSMRSAIVCPNPNCLHNDPDNCYAFGMMNHPVIYGNKLYFFQTSTAFNDGAVIDSTTVYSSEPDGTNRKKLCSTDEGILAYYDRAVLVNDSLYFCLTKYNYDQFGRNTQAKEVILCSYSISENKFSRLSDIGQGISTSNWLFGIFNGEIYIDFSYLESEATPEDFMNTDTIPEFKRSLYKYNIAAKELTRCEDNVTDIQSGWLIKRDDDSTTLKNESGKEITLPFSSDLIILNDYAFDVADKIAFNLSTGKEYSLDLRQEYCEIIYYIDKSYITKSLSPSGDYIYDKIPESELLGDEIK